MILKDGDCPECGTTLDEGTCQDCGVTYVVEDGEVIAP